MSLWVVHTPRTSFTLRVYLHRDTHRCYPRLLSFTASLSTHPARGLWLWYRTGWMLGQPLETLALNWCSFVIWYRILSGSSLASFGCFLCLSIDVWHPASSSGSLPLTSRWSLLHCPPVKNDRWSQAYWNDRIFRSQILFALARAAGAADRVRPPARHLFCIIYHRQNQDQIANSSNMSSVIDHWCRTVIKYVNLGIC